MDRYVDFVIRYRRILFAAFVLVTLLGVVGASRVDVNSDFAVFQLQSSEYRRTLERMAETFGTADQLVVVVDTGAPTLSAEVVHELRDVQAFMEELPGIRYVNGPTPRRIETQEWSVELAGALSTADLDHLREHYEGMGKLATLVDTGGSVSGVYSLFPGDGFEQRSITDLENYLRGRGVAFSITGDSYMQQKVIDYIRGILRFLPATALLLVLVVFRTRMKSLRATLLSILPAGIAALWTMGTIGWIGRPVSIITVLAPIFTVVIGSADGLHFVSHVQDARAEGADRRQSIVATLRMVGVPMIITTVTSMAGFLSLLVMNTRAIADLALFASLGILFAGVATWYVLPLILLGGPEVGVPARTDRTTAPGSRFPRLWGAPSLVATAAVLFLALVGMMNLSTEFNQLAIFRGYTDVRRSFERVAETTGGSIPVYVTVHTAGDPLAPAAGSAMLDLEARLESMREVARVVSAYDAYALIYAGVTASGERSGTDAEPVYPPTPADVAEVDLLLAGEEDPTAHLVSRDARSARLIVFPADLDNNTLDAVAAAVDSADSRLSDMHLEITGAQYLMRELNAEMTANQATAMLLAFSLILALLLISLRAVRPAVASILPIAATVLIMFGFMGMAGISLNLFTATIFSIAIGVGIDYAVHFTSVWMSFERAGYDPEEAAQQAVAYTARPIIANALGLAIGLSALLLSPLQIHVYMSVLMWVAMVAGVFLSLSVLPTLLIGVRRRPRTAAARI